MKSFENHEMSSDLSLTGGFELRYLPEFFDSEEGQTVYDTHTHSFYEIIWFQEGGGTHYVDFVPHPVKENTFFFISPGQLHSYDHSRQKGVVIKFIPSFLNDESATEDIYLKYSVFHAYDTLPYLVIDDESRIRSISHIMRSIEKEITLQGLFGHHRIMQALTRVLLIVFERSVRKASLTNNADEWDKPTTYNQNVHAHFVKFRRALEKEYHHMHNVKDYAELLGVSTKYLNMVVKQCSRKSPLQIINDRILLEAKRQLKYSNKLIKDIAHDLGYEDPSYFVKQFKREIGMLPSDFRDS